MKEATGLPLYEGYGQTESVLQIATFPNMTPKPGSIGKPCPGWDITLIDTEGNVCAPGEEGQICVKLDPRPVGLFTGYLDERRRLQMSWLTVIIRPVTRHGWTKTVTIGFLAVPMT